MTLLHLQTLVRQNNTRTSNITVKEVKDANKKMKNGKAPGEDNVHAEMLKAEQEMPQLLQHILQDVWDNEVIPDAWKRKTIIKLSKKGNLSKCNNWGGITLLSITSNVFCSIILQCITTAVDKLLRQEQEGFRRENNSFTTSLSSIRSVNSHMNGTALIHDVRGL